LKPVTLSGLATLMMAAAMSIHAGTTVTPVGLGNFTAPPNGYAGFDWSGWTVINSNSLGGQNGYTNMGAWTGDPWMFYVAGDNNITPLATFSRSTPFLFESAVLGSAWRDGVTDTVWGYLNGNLVGTAQVTVNTGDAEHPTPAMANFDWVVDRVVMQGSGGHDGYGFPGVQQSHVILASFTYNDEIRFSESDVPEPASMGLMMAGVGVVWLLRKRLA
jgi:PEP-CTERM motif